MAVMYRAILPIEQVYAPDELQTASPGRRLGAYAIDVVISFCTLFVGWYIWLAFTAPNGQTPGKQFLGLYVIKDDGTRAGGGYMWLREALIKDLLFTIVSIITSGIGWIVACLWLLWDKDQQCLWDKIVNTHVAYSPYGFRPQTLEEQEFSGTMRRRQPGQRQTRAADGTVTTFAPGAYRPPATGPVSAATPPSTAGGISDPAASNAAAERLRELRRLRDEDLITEDEYETRRTEAVKDL